MKMSNVRIRLEIFFGELSLILILPLLFGTMYASLDQL
jgi:hypothetical protein